MAMLILAPHVWLRDRLDGMDDHSTGESLQRWYFVVNLLVAPRPPQTGNRLAQINTIGFRSSLLCPVLPLWFSPNCAPPASLRLCVRLLLLPRGGKNVNRTRSRRDAEVGHQHTAVKDLLSEQPSFTLPIFPVFK